MDTNSIAIITLCLFVFVVVFFFRKVFEFLFSKQLKNETFSNLWNELILPIIPLIFGGLTGFISSYPFPQNFSTTTSRIFLGSVCGMFSGLIYRLVKKNIVEKIGSISNITEEKNDDIP